MKSRVAASIALAAALMLGATGCTFSANIATEKPYDPSDGVGAEVGELSIRNALLIGDDPEELNLVMTVVSAADTDRRVTVQWEADGERVTEEIFVGANGRTAFGGPEQDQVLITGSGATIGGLVPVFFAYPGAEGVEVLIPVLDGSLPEYELYIP
ncbi:MAG: DNA modification methylase [Microcella sp.]